MYGKFRSILPIGQKPRQKMGHIISHFAALAMERHWPSLRENWRSYPLPPRQHHEIRRGKLAQGQRPDSNLSKQRFINSLIFKKI